MIDQGLYPDGKVVLTSFESYARYCGPRETVFAALCRKNMGCSHFVIGADGGVGVTADASATREATLRLLDELGDLGIETVFADPDAAVEENLDGAAIRKYIAEDRPIPESVMHPVVQKTIRARLEAGRPVFAE